MDPRFQKRIALPDGWEIIVDHTTNYRSSHRQVTLLKHGSVYAKMRHSAFKAAFKAFTETMEQHQ